MARVLILYATVEGQTERVAEKIADLLRGAGHRVDLQRARRAQEAFDPGAFDGVIVGASVHYGRHPGYLRALLRRQQAALGARHTAFFSLSLSAGGPGARPAAAQRYLKTFLRRSGWQPRLAGVFGGALRYSRYGPIKRLVMQAFVGLAGGDLDASRDYEYTDWDAVARFAGAFDQALSSARA